MLIHYINLHLIVKYIFIGIYAFDSTFRGFKGRKHRIHFTNQTIQFLINKCLIINLYRSFWFFTVRRERPNQTKAYQVFCTCLGWWDQWWPPGHAQPAAHACSSSPGMWRCTGRSDWPQTGRWWTWDQTGCPEGSWHTWLDKQCQTLIGKKIRRYSTQKVSMYRLYW